MHKIPRIPAYTADHYLKAAFLLFVVSFTLFTACGPGAATRWFKGNLHTHTTNSDGDTDPDGVIAWYIDHGYDFLSITDHNHISTVEAFKKWESQDFILISGNEVSDACEGKPVHLLALGLYDDSVKPAHGKTIPETIQNNIDAINAAEALPVMCHPNFGWAFGAAEMAVVRKGFLFEVLNAHPSVNNAGDYTHQSTEEMWDSVLSTGKILYGIGTDDMHKLATYPGKSMAASSKRTIPSARLIHSKATNSTSAPGSPMRKGGWPSPSLFFSTNNF